MTGYGRSELNKNNKNIIVEIKSVNHRYADFSIRVFKNYTFLEDRIRGYLQKYIARGKVDVYLTIESYAEDEQLVFVNDSLAASYINALKYLRDTFNLKDDISVSNIARYNDFFRIEKKEEDQEELWSLVKETLDIAVKDLIAAREREGMHLKNDLIKKSKYIIEIINEIKARAPQMAEEYRKKIEEKVKEFLNNSQLDENRILTEVCLFAEKVNIDEEIVRLHSHLIEFEKMLDSEQPVGRRLDFLIQEMNREINTIGSKANDLYIAQRVVEAKSEIEKLREQVQNIE